MPAVRKRKPSKKGNMGPRRRQKGVRNLSRLPMHLRPPIDFMDMDPRAMVSLYVTSVYTPSPHFLRDPRLRAFARALLVVCLELDAPGTMKWWMCEPVRLSSTTDPDGRSPHITTWSAPCYRTTTPTSSPPSTVCAGSSNTGRSTSAAETYASQAAARCRVSTVGRRERTDSSRP